MQIEVLGTGCAKCRSLARSVQEAADELGIEHEFEHVTDLNELIRRGVISTPALVIDGTLKLSGRSAGATELKKLLQEIVAARS